MHDPIQRFPRMALSVCAAALFLVSSAPSRADTSDGSAAAPTYADLADLADSARIVVRAQVRKIVAVEPARARGVRAGWTRYYIEARTQALIRGDTPLGQSLRYLVDMRPGPRGKAPAIKKKDVLVFATSASGAAGDLQLAAPDAQILWDAAGEARLRGVLAALIALGRPGRITGVREAIHVPGNLAGEGETQFFLDTADATAASITVQHRPGGATAWGVSFSEVAAQVGAPPQRDTLAWYRLACFLPNSLPRGVNLSETATDRALAEADYRVVLGELGLCARNRVR
jgi:hypothetical protein